MSANPIIQAFNVEKHYNKGTIHALDGVTASIERGEVVCVIGPSGSGKSTFLRCLNLLEKPTAGQILKLLGKSKAEAEAQAMALL